MNGKTTMFVIVLVLLGIAGGYYVGANYKLTVQPQTAVSVTAVIPTPTQTPVPQASASAQVSVTTTPVDETANILTAVKTGLIAEHGPDAASMTITVSKIVGNFAQGGASASGGGGMWLAAKVNSIWKLVWDGNGTISCASVNPYNFPTSMVQQCY